MLSAAVGFVVVETRSRCCSYRDGVVLGRMMASCMTTAAHSQQLGSRGPGGASSPLRDLSARFKNCPSKTRFGRDVSSLIGVGGRGASRPSTGDVERMVRISALSIRFQCAICFLCRGDPSQDRPFGHGWPTISSENPDLSPISDPRL